MKQVRVKFTKPYLLTVAEFSKLTTIGEDTVRRLVREDKDFPAIRIGRDIKIVAKEVDHYLKKRIGQDLRI